MPLAALSFATFALSQFSSKKIDIQLDKGIDVNLGSEPVQMNSGKFPILTIGQATFHFETQRIDLTPKPAAPKEQPPGLYGYRWQWLEKPEDHLPFDIGVREGPFLSATVKLSVAQYNKVTYRVSCAIFSKDGSLLGTANHDEQVEYVRLSRMPTMFRDVTFDFGASRNFKDAAYAIFAVSNPKVARVEN